jgi:hypothetical protein
MWQSLLIELGITLVKSYIKSSESKKDDKILDIVKTGADYLSKKPNNTLDTYTSDNLSQKKMKTIQKVY